jgi:hypothetical protein
LLKQIPFDASQRAYDHVSFGACVEGVLGAFEEQRLPAFNLLWRWPLLFHANENGARVVAEINTRPYELLRMRHVLDNERWRFKVTP